MEVILRLDDVAALDVSTAKRTTRWQSGEARSLLYLVLARFLLRAGTITTIWKEEGAQAPGEPNLFAKVFQVR